MYMYMCMCMRMRECVCGLCKIGLSGTCSTVQHSKYSAVQYSTVQYTGQYAEAIISIIKMLDVFKRQGRCFYK